MHSNDIASKPRIKSGKIILFVVVCLILAGFGIRSRAMQENDLRKKTTGDAIPVVSIVKPKAGSTTDDIILPGRVTAWHEAPIYARTNGYVASWKTDIGTHVKEGDVLAEIDTPEIDAELRQTIADLATADANNKLAQTTAKRWKTLLKSDSVTKQEADEKIGDAAAKSAALASALANRDRLQQLESFKRIVAPFDGVISDRRIDTGSLINSGSGTAAQELFHIVDKSKLRVYVDVPQSYTQRLTPGMTAELHFAEYPGKTFPAVLSANANALDPMTRTLRVEFTVDNAQEELLPGGYTEVHIQVTSQGDGLRIPVNTLLFRPAGVMIAVVDNTNHAKIGKIAVGRDFGIEIEVKSGITAEDKVIVNPPDSLVDGQEVHIATPQEEKKTGADSSAKADKK